MNKKGIFELGDLILWLYRIILLTLSALVIAFIVNSHFGRDVDVRPVESSIVAMRLPNCFAEEGVIELSNFNKEILEKCIDSENVELSVKLDFLDTREDMEIESEKFDVLSPLCVLEGQNVPYCAENKEYVLVRDVDTIYRAQLIEKIVTKKEVFEKSLIKLNK